MGPTATPAPRAEVTFTVRLPEPLLAGEILVISVLDEVTGLALNAVDYQLTPIDTVTYTTKLAIPDLSVIRYRYVRRNGVRVTEDTNLDELIRYRLFYVSGPTQITDTVSSWGDKPVNTVSGNIFGTVVNADTGAPIPDIMVTAGGVQIQTDSAGRFELPGLRGGTHNLAAYALDGMFETFQQGATVAGNQATPVQVRMKPAPLVTVLFNDGYIPAGVLAAAGQYAENRYFGKPCGLMDQLTSATGGTSHIDFASPSAPRVEGVPLDPEAAGYTLCVVQTGGSHADLTSDYASIPDEMREAARCCGAEDCRDLSREQPEKSEEEHKGKQRIE